MDIIERFTAWAKSNNWNIVMEPEKRELPENRETRGTCASVIELPREGNSDEVEAS